MLRGTAARAAWMMAALTLLTPWVGRAEPDRAKKQGQLSVLTYNVAGLPEGFSNVTPTRNLPLIGALLNKFDVALVQEDFAYPALLRQNLRLAYQSPAFVRGDQMHFGDGLSLFSKLPLGDVTRVAWRSCHGVFDSYLDCLTPKGFARSRLELSPGVLVDLYVAHFDAGPGRADRAARAEQLEQLVATLVSVSAGSAVVLGGDFNLTAAELPAFNARLAALGFADACAELRCGQPYRLDRVLVRSSAALSLKLKTWRIAPGFRDGRGRALSDHEPVVVTLSWSTKP